MEQNAFHLVYLFAIFTATLLLPIGLGLVAVLWEGRSQRKPETPAAPAADRSEV